MTEVAVTNWSDEIDEVLGNDLTAGLACATQCGGTVVIAVGTLGLRDRETGTVTFTTSLGVGKKLDRIRAEPRVALAFHTRRHGLGSMSPLFVLVQGTARIVMDASQPLIDQIAEGAARHLSITGTPRRAQRFWDWWLKEYTAVRVPVVVTATRIMTWPNLFCAGPATVLGASPPADPPPRTPPAKGTAPRVDPARAARRIQKLPHQLLGYLDADGAPTIAPVQVTGTDANGLGVAAAPDLLPAGGRRAGLLAHDYRPRLEGLTTRYLTGWLDRTAGQHATYAPHTDKGYAAPPNKTLVLLVNGGVTKYGVRKAVHQGTLTEFPTPLHARTQGGDPTHPRSGVDRQYRIR
jgi:hypothetical protein